MTGTAQTRSEARAALRETPLPPLFGRCTATQRQHEGLDAKVRAVTAMCEALAGDAPLTADLDPRTLLRQWSIELSRHFSREEAANYYGTLAEENPELGVRIDELRDEHATILGQLERLVVLSYDRIRRDELARRINYSRVSRLTNWQRPP
jgi:uncharacterized protein (DUF2249 family)